MPELTREQIQALRAGITPGEWCHLKVPRLDGIGANHYVLVDLSEGGDHAVCGVFGVSTPANAQAIAALPDVLAALEAALEELEELRPEVDAWRLNAVQAAQESPSTMRLRTPAEINDYFDALGRELADHDTQARTGCCGSWGTDGWPPRQTEPLCLGAPQGLVAGKGLVPAQHGVRNLGGPLVPHPSALIALNSAEGAVVARPGEVKLHDGVVASPVHRRCVIPVR